MKFKRWLSLLLVMAIVLSSLLSSGFLANAFESADTSEVIALQNVSGTAEEEITNFSEATDAVTEDTDVQGGPEDPDDLDVDVPNPEDVPENVPDVSAAEEDDADNMSPMSLLPLPEIKAYLVLNNYSEEEIKAMPLSTVLSLLQDSDGNYITIPSTATVVWAHFKDDKGNLLRDEYHVISRDETVDLSDFEYSTGYTMELIVGSANQLDPNNIRYIVRTYITNSIHEELNFELYTEDTNGARQKIVPTKQRTVGMVVAGTSSTTNIFIVPDHVDGTEYYLGITSIADEHPNIKVDIYTQLEFLNYMVSGPDAATPITNEILNRDMTQQGAGHKTVLDQTNDYMAVMEHNTYAVVMTDQATGSLCDYRYQTIYVVPGILSFEANAYTYENGQMVDVAAYKGSLAELRDLGVNVGGVIQGTAIEQLCVMLKEGYSSGTNYYIVLDADSLEYGSSTKTHITKAVLGLYDSIESATDEPDIKEQLFPPNTDTVPYGYLLSYDSGDYGAYAYFTMFFDDGSSAQIEVVILNYSEELYASKMVNFFDAPIVGAQDPWFRVDGAKQGDNVLDTYIVENGKAINMDTLYGYGYQTIFINDKNVDLSKLKPTFWFGDDERVRTFAVSPTTGNEQFSGESERDFSNGALQYGTVIEDSNGSHTKNYQVAFVKKESGAKLFVNGPSSREIFLDEYFEYKHDILIANVGDAPLTGLTVKLDATNVRLDDYWTVGGAGNDTLAPFTTTSSYTEYGELANIAKIRLLPDGDGEIEGTLTISADGQKDVVIALSGRASNPSIITKDLDDAVKYVPYSYLVSTNNMHDWNDVTFSIVSGELPEGVELYPTTGEIYGVPQESGEFHFRVEATYSSEYFEPSYVDLTLVVKENTNENVYNASDVGYEIKQPIGEDTDGDHNFVLKETGDQVFISYGEYSQFVGLWLNGVKLIEGEDYTTEEGSTVITIRGETFDDLEDGSSNTIAAEFRSEDEDGEGEGDLNRTAQNFTVENSQTDPAIENVIALINAIPSHITLDAKAAIQRARAAYNALTDSQKAAVTNYDRLLEAENALATLERDITAANEVIALIDAIPTPVTLNDRAAVNNARSAYNALTATQKTYVTNYNKLTAAESRLAELEEEERENAQVNEVIALINAIPDPVTLNDKTTVETARAAYEALSAAQKERVINYSKLTAAEQTIAALEALERADEEDKAAANRVIEIINNLPDSITLQDKAAVEEARAAYDALTDTQKQLVTNYDKLLRAEKTIAALEAYESATESDKAAADAVIALIDALPDDIELGDKAAVEAARNAYEALTDVQKQIVTNYDKLVAAEVTIAELENDEYQKNQFVAIVVHIVDANGKSLPDYIVEIHSTAQNGRTDQNGYVRFNDIDMGTHTITIKGKDGKALASKEFSIVAGTALELKENEITAENRSILTLTVQFDKNTISFLEVEEGDKTPEGNNNNEEPAIDISSPQTGDETNLFPWYILLIFCLFGLIATIRYSWKRSHGSI